MLEQWIELSEDPLDVLHNLVNDVLPRYEEEGKLEEYPLLNDDTVIHYYQVTYSQAISGTVLIKLI